jgi:hypothetical protein
VDCDDIRTLLQSRRALPPEATRHAVGCEACAAMIAAAPHLPIDAGEGQGDRALLSATFAAIDADHGVAARLRERGFAARLGLALVLALAVPIAIVIATPRGDFGEYPRARLIAELAVLAVAWALAAAVTLRPLQRALPAALRIAATVLALIAVASLASLPPAHEHVAMQLGAGFVTQALKCLAFGTLAAIPSWLALHLLARDAGGRRLLVLAAAATVVGVASVFLHCSIVDPRHLWAGHATIALPLAIWAWLRGRG